MKPAPLTANYLSACLRIRLRANSGTGISPVLSAIRGNRTGETPVPLFPKHALPLLAALSLAVASAGAATAPTGLHGVPEALGLQTNQLAQHFTVQQIAASVPANVLWLGDTASFTFQVTNKTKEPLLAAGQVTVITYATSSDPANPFFQTIRKTGEAGATAITVDIPANGFTNLTIQPPIPDKCGAYILVLDLADHGRDFAAACVRTLAALPGRVQYPTYALDALSGQPEELALFQRLGVKATRNELGYFPTTAPDFQKRMDQLTEKMQAMASNNVTVMLTISTGTAPQPLGRPRPFLDETGQFLPGKADIAALPECDADFQKWCRIVAGTFGWPKGPVNAIELWNEPWEGVSISGWGADILRYRDLYTHMAQGIDQARREDGVQVLIGGTCSSMNTEDKLFCDGTDTFLQWLDFTSLHYQPLSAEPVLVQKYLNRQSPNGPVRVWDTESWVANTEDRVAAVIASMRAQGLSRSAGVFHDNVRVIQQARERLDKGIQPVTVVHAWAPAAAIAATQHFIGERSFRELLFQNGLPWIFVFDGLANPDDGTLVIVGDLGGIYNPDSLLFRSAKGLTTLAHAEKIAALKKQIAALPADTLAKDKRELQGVLKHLELLDGATLTLPDGDGLFSLYDFFGNAVPSHAGQIVVPLNDLGYFLRANGTAGSFAKLIAAVTAARINGYEPLAIAAHDLTAPVTQQPVLRLKLTNILNRPVTGRFQVTLGDLKLDGVPESLTLAGHETKELAVKVTGGPAAPSNIYPLAVNFDAGADGKAVHTEELHVNFIAKRTIKVDGQLDDWAGVLPQPMHSEAGATASVTEKAWLPFLKFDEAAGQGFASVYLAYDATNFYFAAKIADTTPDEGGVRYATRDDDQYFYPEKCTGVTRNPKTKEIVKTEELTWPADVRRYSYRKRPETPSGNNTDNVQIGFNVVPPSAKGWAENPPGTMPHFMIYKTTDYEYAFNQVAEKFGGGTEIWRLLAPGVPYKHYYPRQPKAAVDGGPVTNGQLVMRRDGDMRIVEAALPWSELPDVKQRLDAGETIKFSCRVNDNKALSYELATGRSVSKATNYAFHNLWMTSWANELEFAFER